ncbi:unnamed protein product [Urochloa humidicola]
MCQARGLPEQRSGGRCGSISDAPTGLLSMSDVQPLVRGFIYHLKHLLRYLRIAKDDIVILHGIEDKKTTEERA